MPDIKERLGLRVKYTTVESGSTMESAFKVNCFDSSSA